MRACLCPAILSDLPANVYLDAWEEALFWKVRGASSQLCSRGHKVNTGTQCPSSKACNVKLTMSMCWAAVGRLARVLEKRKPRIKDASSSRSPMLTQRGSAGLATCPPAHMQAKARA